MDFALGPFLGTLSWGMFATLSFGLAAAVLWWLIRKKRDRLWLPTTRLIKMEHVPLPQLQMIKPPWLAFLSFLCLLGLLLGTSLRPYELIYAPKDNDQPRVHVIIDLSPSVNAQIAIEGYRTTVRDTLSALLSRVKLTVARSDGGNIVEVNSDDDISKITDELDFHRAGLRIGSLFNAQLAALSDIDRMVIISDDDAYSWGDTDWAALQENFDIAWVPVQAKTLAHGNTFINGVHDMSIPGSNHVDVEVEMLRVGDKMTGENAALLVKHGDTMLAEVPIVFPAQKDRILVRMQWDVALITPSKDPADHLTFQLKLNGQDGLSLDNDFYTALSAQAYKALLVGPSFGERFLEDPSFLLQRALSVVGVRLDRFDRIDTTAPPFKDYHVSVFLGGGGLGVDQFCPRVLPAKDAPYDDQRKVWLLPAVADAHYGELCWCYARLALEDLTFNEKMPVFCKEVETRAQYVDVVSSLGGKQIGGEIGLSDTALALRTTSKSEGADIITLTVPLSPRPGEGIGVVRLPLLVRAFLNLQGVVNNDAQTSALSAWPRVADVSAAPVLQRHVPMALSNVPLSESLLNHMNAAKMPKAWSTLNDPSFTASLLQRKERDATNWLKVIGGVMIFALLLELLTVVFFVVKARRLKAAAALLLFVVFYLLTPRPGVAADVQFQALGYGPIGQQTASKLSDEVEGRTSISFDPKIASYTSFSQAAEEQGWLWVKDLALIKDKNGALNPRVVLWLRRGGFLVIEQNAPDATLQTLTAAVSGLRKGEGWQVIPPDHELMRSYHLLDVLPSCQNTIWRGFQFDGRLAMIVIPYNFLESLIDRPQSPSCPIRASHEQSVRAFINLLMVVLATDYKRDQIHLPEILKRLR